MGRYNRRGTEKVFLVTTISNAAAPTAAEINAGVRIDSYLRALTGFRSEVEDLDAADQSSSFNKTIPGGETPENSSMTFYASDTLADGEETTRAAFIIGASRYIVFVPRGTVASAAKADVFPVRIKSNNDDKGVENAAATYTVGMSIYNPPNKQVAIA